MYFFCLASWHTFRVTTTVGSWKILWVIRMPLNLLKEMHEILMGERWCVTSSSVEIVNPIISAKSPVKSDHCPINYWVISSKGSLKCRMYSVWDRVEGTTVIFMRLATGLATGYGLFHDIPHFYFWYQIRCLEIMPPSLHSPKPRRYSFLKRKKIHPCIYRLKILLPEFMGIKRFIWDYISQAHHLSINSASSRCVLRRGWFCLRC